MSLEYPSHYDDGSYGQNYENPYGSNDGSYGGYKEFNNHQFGEIEGYGSEDNYRAFSDTSYSERYDGHGRSAEQEERDRLQRKNRTERRRDSLRDDRRERDYRNNRAHGYDSRYSDRDRERDRRERDFDDRAGEKWISHEPTNTIILRGLPQSIVEQDILVELQMFGAPIRELRLMRKSSGASRGFAFMEFQNKDDAVRWMDANQHKLVLQNRYSCTMDFSTQKDPKNYLLHRMDWDCSKCGVHNFKRRDYCFKCNMSRYESGKSQADGFDHIGTNPCNTLLFRGLDALTNEENLTRALNAVMPMTCKNIQVIRDVTTGVSHGYAFVELSSVGESMGVFDTIQAMSPPLEVDGKQILVSYARNTFATSIATITAAGANQGWDPSSESYKNYDSFYYLGQYYEGYDYSKYTAECGHAPATIKTTDSTNAAAAVAQFAIQQAQAAKQYHKQVQQQKKIAEMSTEERLAQQAQAWKQKSEETTTTTGLPQELKKYSAPDVTQYQYDETSGYYYDPVTSLYYDANTQYYYNSQTSQFLYWDAEQSTYLPAPTSKEESSGDKSEDKKEDKKEGKDKKEKVKIAKKIAKDMEKWAKSMNAQKEAMKDGIKKIIIPNLTGKKESTAADAGFAILEKLKSSPSEDKKLMPPPTLPVSSTPTGQEQTKPGLVASYGGDSDEEEDDDTSGEPIDESKLLDLNKMACLLCKRQFQGKEQLTRHTQMSDLHKQNLQKLRQSSDNGQLGASGMQYRDRAKERREKIGSIAPPARKRPPIPEPFEQPTKAGIGEDNIGSKLLQKMGWSSGQGLGKSGQGIVSPIEAERRNVTAAGLGMAGAKVNIDDSDNYKVALKKTLFARYKELD